MKSKLFAPMRWRAEKDLTISHAASRLVHRLCSHVRNDFHRLPDAPFPLPWPLVASFTGVGKKQAYRLVGELVKHNYIAFDGLRGSPPTGFFRLLLVDKNVHLDSDKNVHLDSDKNVHLDSDKNVHGHISSPFGKKMNKEKGLKRGNKSSLRSEDGIGEQQAAAPRGEGKDGGGTAPPSASMEDVAARRKAWTEAVNGS